MRIGFSKNNTGSALLGALGAAAAGIISFMTIQGMIFKAKSQLSSQISSSAYIHVLDSALNLTIAGVKNRWCFSSSMLSDPICNLAHVGSVERLLIAQDTVKFVQSFMQENVDYIGQITLSEIQRTVSLNQISTGHPLYTLAQSIPLDEIQAIQFTIKRVNQVTEPTRSREVLLDLQVGFVSSNQTISKLKAKSRIAVFPRELSGLALVLPNNLNLSGPPPVAAYDSAIPALGSAVPGLNFMSPVLVNGDLEIPGSATGNGPVSFMDRVYLGGNLRKNGQVFVPVTAGGTNSDLLSAIPGAGGLRGGVELEPGRDPGLDALGGIEPEVLLTTDIMSLCQERLNGRFELAATDQMRTLVRPSATNSLVTEFSMGHINSFYPQDGVDIQIQRLTGALNANLVEGNRPLGDSPSVRLVFEVNGFGGVNQPHVYQAEMALGDSIHVTLGTNQIAVHLDPLFLDPAQPNEPEPNRFNIRLAPQGNPDLRPFPVVPGSLNFAAPYVRVTVEPFDYGYRDGLNQRNASNPQDRTKVNGFTYRYNGTSFVRSVGPGPAVETWFGCPAMDGTSSACMDRLVTTIDPNIMRRLINIEGLSYAALDKACGRVRSYGDSSGEYPAFAGADWSTSFAAQAPTVWGFTEFDAAGTIVKGYNPATLVLDGNNSTFTPAQAQFHVRARMRRCEVASTATFVSGFFVCDEFVIQNRTTPLVIVGTVIANRLTVSTEALQAGIQWRSIFHPQSVLDLQRAQILFAMDAGRNKIACSLNEALPIWLPNLTDEATFNYYNCSPAVLREKADPFRWTAVDPDCGIPTIPVTGAAFSCKRRIVRVLVKELSRNLTL